MSLGCKKHENPRSNQVASEVSLRWLCLFSQRNIDKRVTQNLIYRSIMKVNSLAKSVLVALCQNIVFRQSVLIYNFSNS